MRWTCAALIVLAAPFWRSDASILWAGAALLSFFALLHWAEREEVVA